MPMETVRAPTGRGGGLTARTIRPARGPVRSDRDHVVSCASTSTSLPRPAVAALALVAALAIALSLTSRAEAVVGGTPTTHSSWPSLVALLDSRVADPFDAQFCAGTLIGGATC